MSQLVRLVQTAFRHVDLWGPQQWLLALIIVLSIGWMCLRGLGSRRNF